MNFTTETKSKECNLYVLYFVYNCNFYKLSLRVADVSVLAIEVFYN